MNSLGMAFTGDAHFCSQNVGNWYIHSLADESLVSQVKPASLQGFPS
jgi:hypothetical protein